MLEDSFKVGVLSVNFIKKRLQQWCFPLKFAKSLRTPILKNICQRLILSIKDQSSCRVETSQLTGKANSLVGFYMSGTAAFKWGNGGKWTTKEISHFLPNVLFWSPWKIRKPKVFWCFQRDQKRTLERKGLIMVVNLERWLEEYIHIFEKYFRDVFGTLLNI